MSGLKGSKTEKNLLGAFAGESQARNRYTMAAKKASQEGFEQVAAIFLETADNELQHAKQFYKFLEGGMVEITAMFPAGKVGSTEENLEAAAGGENEEWTLLYPEAAKVARGEGFVDVAVTFEEIAAVEKEHEARYRKLLDNLRKDKVFSKEKPVRWKCRVCGRVIEGTEAPEQCPACKHAKKYFEIAAENY